MDETRFEELFLEVERWIDQARRHMIVANELTQPVISALATMMSDTVGFLTQAPSFLEIVARVNALTDARALFFGLAIENACKARLIETGKIKVQGGAAKGLRVDHNVLAMVKETGYSPSQEEEEFLALVAYQLRTLAKYPIAKDLRTQNTFTGRAIGARQVESELVSNIIVSVLKEPRLVSRFKMGHYFSADIGKVAKPGS